MTPANIITPCIKANPPAKIQNSIFTGDCGGTLWRGEALAGKLHDITSLLTCYIYSNGGGCERIGYASAPML